jgi:hypothetical protein
VDSVLVLAYDRQHFTVILHRYEHHDIIRLQIVKSSTSDSRAFLRLQKSDLVNSQHPMTNSVAAADAYPVLNGISIPIHYA